MKRAETCSCSLCNKLYISLPPYSCVRQVYTLQSTCVLVGQIKNLIMSTCTVQLLRKKCILHLLDKYTKMGLKCCWLVLKSLFIFLSFRIRNSGNHRENYDCSLTIEIRARNTRNVVALYLRYTKSPEGPEREVMAAYLGCCLKGRF